MLDIIIKPGEEDFTETVFLLIDYAVGVPRTQRQRTRERLASLLGWSVAGEELKTLKLFENVLRKYCVGELDAGRFRSHFTNLSSVQQDRLVEIVNLRKAEIAQRLIDEVNRREGGVPLVEWFDWNVSWIMGSSSLASIRQQLCTVTFACRDVDAKGTTISFEMDRQQVDEAIRQLEAVA
ncbi:uncharacterized protein LOC131210827 [Anopheles bellator]|uniref:uncharacterized protein LOC131210827 n=1 Tax=Anopheles bellator TaxID=139047 RepID=UPI002649049E|nr:uncharacterized protein LOC131210827 [Anopheles bellator]